MHSRLIATLSVCLVTAVTCFAAEAPSDLPQAALTLGAQGGEGEFEVYADFLVPVYLSESGLWFLNPRASASDNDEEEANIGLGYRHLFSERNLILGGNAYYDSRWTQHDNQFNQLGLGIECLTKWVDARANVYLPEDDEELVDRFTEQAVAVDVYEEWNDPYATGHEITQTGERRTTTTTTTYLFERFEQAREGWDAEIGVKLPGIDQFAEVRVFGGYYSWENEYTERDDIEGFKGRVEARVLPILYADAQIFEDKELNGTDWYVGGRINLPFDCQALANGRNPFAGTKDRTKKMEQNFSDRLYEMVIRDVKIQTEVSDYEENEEERVVDVRVDKKRLEDTLLDDVMFVDDDADDDPGPDDPTISDLNEDGTAEHPYDEIQEGVDNASSPVYVYEGNYYENVTMADGVDVIGEGEPIYANGGKVFGGGAYPTVNGDMEGPSFTLANNVRLAGFHVVNYDTDAAALPTWGLFGDPITRAGIYAANVDGFEIHNNDIERCTAGIRLENNALASFSPVVTWNEIDDCNNGLVIRQQGGTDLNVMMYGNDISKNNTVGARIRYGNVLNVAVHAERNLFFDNGTDGLIINANGPGNDYFALRAINNIFDDNGDNGLIANIGVNEEATFFIHDNAFNYNAWSALATPNAGLALNVTALGAAVMDPTIDVVMTDNLLIGNENRGGVLNLAAPNGIVFATVDKNYVSDWDVGGAGLGLDIDITANQAAWLDMNNNWISHGWWYGDDGADIDLAADTVIVTLYDNNTPWCGDDGMNINAVGANGLTAVLFGNHSANNNWDEGLEIFARQLNGDSIVAGGYTQDDALEFAGALLAGTITGPEEGLAMLNSYAALHNEADYNLGMGIEITSQGSDDSVILLGNTRANGNQSPLATEAGIQLDAQTIGDDAFVVVANTIANDNASSGLRVRSNSGGSDAMISLLNVDTVGNGYRGTWLNLAAAQDASLFVQDSVFADNGEAGLRLAGGPATTWNLDLGGGPIGSEGRNSFYGNVGFGIDNQTAGQATIANNYWGGLGPAPAVDLGPLPLPPRFVNPGTDWLANDPND